MVWRKVFSEKMVLGWNNEQELESLNRTGNRKTKRKNKIGWLDWPDWLIDWLTDRAWPEKGNRKNVLFSNSAEFSAFFLGFSDSPSEKKKWASRLCPSAILQRRGLCGWLEHLLKDCKTWSKYLFVKENSTCLHRRHKIQYKLKDRSLHVTVVA